jgi:hypothetical protein
MRRADFYRLSRRLQERFMMAASGIGLRAPILFVPLRSNSHLVWLMLAAAGLVGLSWSLAWGFGRLDSRWALAPRWMMLGYGALLGLTVSSALAAASARASIRQLPYKPGIYLFPMGLIRASGPILDAYAWSELVECEIVPRPLRLTLEFSGARSFTLALQQEAQATAVLARIREAQQRFREASGADGLSSLSTLDPLTDDGIPNPLLSDLPLSERHGWWARGWWWLGPLAGALLAYPLWMTRDRLSERILFRQARSLDTPDAYQAYLAAGGQDRQVGRALLPRAELRIAERTASPEAIERVLRRYPDAQIRPEYDQALRRALLVELDKAKRTKAPGALRRFAREQPHRELVAAEIESALHQLYRSAQAKYQTDAAGKRPERIAFVERLLAHAERHGARAEIRFARQFLPSVAVADQRILTSPYAQGPTWLPSPYFAGDYASRRERRAAEILGQRLAQTLPRELVSFELGPPLVEGQADIAAIDVPTLAIEHTTLMNGVHVIQKPRGAFVGIGVLFRALLRLPGDHRPVVFKWSYWQAPDLARIREQRLSPEQVYEELGTDAFAQFCAKYLASWFRTP